MLVGAWGVTSSLCEENTTYPGCDFAFPERTGEDCGRDWLVPAMLEEEEEEEEEASSPELLFDEREKGPGKLSSMEARKRNNSKMINQVSCKYCFIYRFVFWQDLENLVTWIILVDAVRLWPISIQSLLTASCFSRNHFIICCIPAVSLCSIFTHIHRWEEKNWQNKGQD